MPLERGRRWLTYRLHPRHRYHVVKTQLPYGYHESDDRMIYAVFAILCDYVEIELSATSSSKKYRDKEEGLACLEHMAAFNEKLPPNTPAHELLSASEEAFYKELLVLYKWWYEEFLRYDTILEEKTPGYPFVDTFRGDVLDAPTTKTVLSTIIYNEWSEMREKLTAEQKRTADEMLLRACKIRHFLWT